MRASDIIRELPQLTEADRRAIREVLVEIANGNPDVALCNETALEGALMLDRLENEDASRQSKDLAPGSTEWRHGNFIRHQPLTGYIIKL